MACHFSPPAPGERSVLPHPLMLPQKATSQTLNYQGRRPGLRHNMTAPCSHPARCPSCPCLHLRPRACSCARACTCARTCPCASAPHAPMHVVTSMQVDARTPIRDAPPPRDDALQSQRLGAPIGWRGTQLAPLVARIGDHDRSRRRSRSAAAGFELQRRLVCLPAPPALPSLA